MKWFLIIGGLGVAGVGGWYLWSHYGSSLSTGLRSKPKSTADKVKDEAHALGIDAGHLLGDKVSGAVGGAGGKILGGLTQGLTSAVSDEIVDLFNG